MLPASGTNRIINKYAFFIKRELVKKPGYCPSSFCGSITELKQTRFWASHVNRKCGLFPSTMPLRDLICISVFTHKKKICLRIIGKNTTRWLPVDVRRSKTSLLKLPIMGRDEVEVNKNGKKTRPIFSHFDWTNLVNKGFIIITKKRTFSCGTNAWNPEWVHLARSLSQSKHRIRFILPAGGVSHI